MATGGDRDLSDLAIEKLSEKIAVKEMISVAVKYFGVDYEEIDNLKTKHRDDITWISRDLLRGWRRSNPSDNQIQVSEFLRQNKGSVAVVKERSQRFDNMSIRDLI